MNIGLGIGIPFTRSSLWASIFTPSALFLDGSTQGVWYDPSDNTTLFQDAAGTMPVTAVEQPVGLVLDKSKGLVLGPELVTNGDFSGGTTGWVPQAGWSISSAQGVAAATSGALYQQNVLLSTAKRYLVTFDVIVTSGTVYATAGSRQGPNRTVSGKYSAYLNPSSVSNQIEIWGSGFTGTVDNISVRELPGNHAFNSSGNSANFPVLSARYNVLNNTETLATQSVTTRAAKYILSFWGTGSVALSGTYTGTLVGTGADNRVYVEFTATAGTLTLTVTGSVLKAQLEEL